MINMKFNIEVNTEKQSVFILHQEETRFTKMLKHKLKNMNIGIFSGARINLTNLEKYTACFVVQSEMLHPSIVSGKNSKKFIYIFFGQDEISQEYTKYCDDNKLSNIKIVNLNTEPRYYKEDLESIFWFAFSRTTDTYLNIARNLSLEKIGLQNKINKNFKLSKKHLIISGVICIFLSQIIFLIPLSAATLLHYSAYNKINSNSKTSVDPYISSASGYLDVADRMFDFSRPILHFFSIALPFEQFIQANTSISKLLLTYNLVNNESKEIIDSIFNPIGNTNNSERVKKIVDAISETTTHLNYILELSKSYNFDSNQKIISKIENLKRAVNIINTFKPYLGSVFGERRPKKYLLLFANNMELRPGGGFIGSYATFEADNFTIRNLKVFDVYDADGQLTARIEPPKPISEMLNQPFWYLRDSAFSPDFKENFLKAEEFLKLEMNEDGFDYGILITTSAVKNIISAMGTVVMPDYNEEITAENFYIKTQIHAEDNFFPGSTQKKNFLSDLLQQIIIRLGTADPALLLTAFETSLNQKQIAIYSKEEKLQESLKKEFWSGTLISPDCSKDIMEPCIADYSYQFDANLGVNKANFFIKKPSTLKAKLDSTGKITNTLTVNFYNDSIDGVYPGGIYKNYFQHYLPPNSKIVKVILDGKELENYDSTNLRYRTIGFPMIVKTQSSAKVEIVYELPTSIIASKGFYQMILQKQIGSPNYDLNFTFEVPQNFTIVRHNLSPLVNDKNINYNTSISTDRIFLIEFDKVSK